VTFRQNWGEDRVWFHDNAGSLRSVPTSWTDAAPMNVFVVVAAGRSLFRVATHRFRDACASCCFGFGERQRLIISLSRQSGRASCASRIAWISAQNFAQRALALQMALAA